MRVFLIAIFLGITVLTGCNRPPKACMEIDQTTVSTGVTVTFTSCSKRALSYEWFMSGPDGAPENSIGWSDPQIQHAFTIPGTYTITLNVYNKFSYLGDMATTTGTVTVQ